MGDFRVTLALEMLIYLASKLRFLALGKPFPRLIYRTLLFV